MPVRVHLVFLVRTKDFTADAHDMVHDEVDGELESQTHSDHGRVEFMKVFFSLVDRIEVDFGFLRATGVIAAPRIHTSRSANCFVYRKWERL